MRHVLTNFLEDNHVEAATDGPEDLCGALAGRAWVPLEHGKAVLAVHEVASWVGERDARSRASGCRAVTWRVHRTAAWGMTHNQCRLRRECGWVFPPGRYWLSATVNWKAKKKCMWSPDQLVFLTRRY